MANVPPALQRVMDEQTAQFSRQMLLLKARIAWMSRDLERLRAAKAAADGLDPVDGSDG